MAAELTHTTSEVADMFSVRETPWHEEGHVLRDAPGYDEALALANLDYLVVKEPTYRKVGDNEFVENASAFITKRVDTGAELGMVGPDYQPVQNGDAFRVLKPLIDEGVATLETGGALRKGADAWLMVKWDLARFNPIVREVFTDEVVPFSLVATNHVGRRGVLLKNTPVRVVCANTLGAAESSVGHSVNVRHTGDATERLVDAAHSLWDGIIERYDRLALSYRALKQTVLDEAAFQRLVVDAVVADPRHDRRFNPEAKLAEMVVARYERKVERLHHLWEHGKGHVGDHSAWEAYNGAVEALDHDRDLFPTRAGSYRTASLLDGDLAKRKDAVLASLVEEVAA